jgi:hypothetical protein
MAAKAMIDSGGRRCGIERRQLSYDMHIPEMRSGEDRRKMYDRRNGIDRRIGRQVAQNVLELRSEQDRRIGMKRRFAFA